MYEIWKDFLMTLFDFKTSGEANEGSKARTTLRWGGGGGIFLNFKCPERPFPAI